MFLTLRWNEDAFSFGGAKRMFALASAWFSIAGCSHLSSITYYDPTTFKNLTDLKPDVVELYEGFGEKSLDSARIAAIRLKLSQIYEYEKGKGEKNAETYQQIDKIRDMYKRHVANRLRNGPWTPAFLGDKVEEISRAFDIAIQTEA